MSFDVLSSNTSDSASVDILRQLRKSKKVLDNSKTGEGEGIGIGSLACPPRDSGELDRRSSG